MNLRFLLLICFLFNLSTGLGQRAFSDRRFKAIYIEAYGNNVVQSQHAAYGVWSLNYDTRFQKGRLDGWGVRMGLGTQTTGDYSRYYKSYYSPIMINKVTGHRRVALETGIGSTLLMTYWYTTDNQTGQQVQQHSLTHTLFGNVGLRLQPLKLGPFARLCWTPILSESGRIDYRNIGISLGFAFH